MKRIVVLGNNGSGKTTVAGKLSQKLALPLIHLDKFYFRPGWVPVSKEEWDKIHEDLIKGESWVIDGLYPRTLDKRLKAADTIIFLDLPKWLTLYRIVSRRIKDRGKVRQDLPEYLREQLSWRFIKRHSLFSRRRLLEKLTNLQGKKVVILSNRKQIDEFLSGL